MSDAEKIAAFENLAAALTNCWSNGRWCWWNPTPTCGSATMRDTRDEAVRDLVEWAEKTARSQRKKLL